MTSGISNQYNELYEFLATHTFGGQSWQQVADRNNDTVIVKQEFTSFIEKWCPENINHDKDLIAQFWQKIDTTANTDKFRYHGTQYVNTGALDRDELAAFNADVTKMGEGKKVTNIEIIDDKPYTPAMVDLYNNFFVPDCHVDSVKEYYNYGETFKLGTSIDNHLNNHSDVSEGDIINIIRKNARGETLTAEELQTLNAIGLGNDANGWNYTRKCFVKSNCLYNAQNFCNQQYGNYSSLTAVALDSYKTELENNVTSGQYKKYADAIKEITGALSFEQSNAMVNLKDAIAVITGYSDINYTATKSKSSDRIADINKAGEAMLAQANQNSEVSSLLERQSGNISTIKSIDNKALKDSLSVTRNVNQNARGAVTQLAHANQISQGVLSELNVDAGVLESTLSSKDNDEIDLSANGEESGSGRSQRRAARSSRTDDSQSSDSGSRSSGTRSSSSRSSGSSGSYSTRNGSGLRDSVPTSNSSNSSNTASTTNGRRTTRTGSTSSTTNNLTGSSESKIASMVYIPADKYVCTSDNPLVQALFEKYGAIITEYIASNDSNPTYQGIIQDAAMKVMTGELASDKVVDYIISQIDANFDQIVPQSVQAEAKKASEPTIIDATTGADSTQGTDTEKAKKFFRSDLKEFLETDFHNNLQTEDSLKEITMGLDKVHLEFGMDANGNITFQNTAARELYNNLLKKVKELFADAYRKGTTYNNYKLPGELPESIIEKLVQAEWLATYTIFGSSEDTISATSFIKCVLNRLGDITIRLCDDSSCLDVIMAHTAHANTDITNGVKYYDQDKTQIINYAGATYGKDAAAAKLSDNDSQAVYATTMDGILQNLKTVYKAYGLKESTIEELFKMAQKEALRIFNDDIRDCPAGCGNNDNFVNYEQFNNKTWTSSDGNYSYGDENSYTQEHKDYWDGNDHRDDDGHTCTIQELVQETLYCFDKFLYSYLGNSAYNYLGKTYSYGSWNI